MLHRVFLSIAIPKDIKEKLLQFKEEYKEIPAKWTDEENLHLTLIFLGNTSDQELIPVIETIQSSVKEHESFELNISSIVYGPSAEKPKMIWAIINASSELKGLQKDLENNLASSEEISFVKERRDFSPHLTLARLKQTEFNIIEVEERQEVNKEISLSFPVSSIEVMESNISKSGVNHTILQSIPLS